MRNIDSRRPSSTVAGGGHVSRRSAGQISGAPAGSPTNAPAGGRRPTNPGNRYGGGDRQPEECPSGEQVWSSRVNAKLRGDSSIDVSSGLAAFLDVAHPVVVERPARTHR